MLIAALLGLAACRPAEKPADAPTPPASRAEAAPAAWESGNIARRITAAPAEPGRLRLELKLPADAKIPQWASEFNLCLPEKKQFEVKLLRYAVGGRPVQGRDDQDRITTGTAGVARIDEPQAMPLTSCGIMRDCAIYRVALTAAFWAAWEQARNAGRGGELAATIEIRWPAGADDGKAALAAEPKGMDNVLRYLVANPADVGRWPVVKPELNDGLTDEPNDSRPAELRGGRWWRLRVDRDGPYRLSGRDLAGLGLGDARALDKVRLFCQGRPVPLHRIKGAGGDAILFYGWGSPSEYDARQVYWMTLAEHAPDPALPEAGAASPGGPAREIGTLRKTARLDRDNTLKLHLSGEFNRIAGGTWVDSELEKDVPVNVPLELTAPALGEGTRLKARFTFHPSGNPASWSGTEAGLLYGSETLARFTFTPDEKAFDQTVELPATIFTAGRTTLTLEVIQATTATLPTADNKEGIWFDAAEVAYEGAPALERGRLILDTAALPPATTGTLYRIGLGAPGGAGQADPCALEIEPARREARRLPLEAGQLAFHADGRRHAEVFDPELAPAPVIEAVDGEDDPLRDDGATALIITHPMFKEAVKPLVELHGRLGYKSRVIDVQRIYDLFSGGQLSPGAIRAYLAHTARHWRGGLPDAVLLFGDCSADYRGDYKGTGNRVPSHTHAMAGDHWPSDYWYSTPIGNDHLPDLMIARIPASSLDDARAVVAKTVRYAELKAPGPWRGTLTMVADNMQGYRAMAEEARRDETPPQIETPRIYLDELPLEDNWYVPRWRIEQAGAEADELRKVSGTATTAIKDRLNSGTAVMEYLGHGSANIWGHERIWFGGGSVNRDSVHLKAGGRYAFIINYACFTGEIDYPVEPWSTCIAEDLLRTPDGGAIGLFVPGGPGMTFIQKTMMRLWHQALFEDRLRGMGELATLVRARMAVGQVSESHLFMHHLLGDPAVPLQFVDDWRPLRLAPEAVEPGGGAVNAALEGIEPARGKARLWLESERGEALWESGPFDYRDGSIRTAVKPPAGLDSPQRLRVKLYAWNEEEGRDLMAAGELSLERPRVAIRSAAATRGGETGLGFAVELANTGRAATGEFTLKILPYPGEADGQPIAAEKMSLAGGERRQVTLGARQAVPETGKAPRFFEAVVETARPPDDTAPAHPAGFRFALTPSEDWIGWAPLLGEWRGGPAGQIRLSALAGAKPATPYRAVLRAADGNVLTSMPLTFTPTGGLFQADLTLPATPGRLPRPDDVVELDGGQGGAAPARMTLGELPRIAPVLRLERGSIRHTPENPTEGETIFITFSVRNAGNAPSPPCVPELLTKPKAEGGQPLPRLTDLPKPSIPELGPGRDWTITLRWDPLHNAGIQTLVVDLNPAAENRGAETLSDQSASYQLYVRTKSKLARGSNLAPLRVNGAAEGTVKLRAEVVNQGETDARNVEVLFYRTPEKKDLLGTVPLTRVPAGGAVIAALECKVNPATDRPVPVIRLKGSSQAIQD